jgi:hypothetical protein
VAVATGQRRRGLQLFSRTNPIKGERVKMQPPVWDQPAIDALPEFFAGGGSADQVMFVDPDGTDEHCLSLIWLKVASNYQLPRHSHSGDCLYYVTAGEVHLGNRVVAAGEGFFVASDAPYAYSAGPDGAEVLEFRGTGRSVNSQIHESPTGWKRILQGVRAHRDGWIEELAPYSQWCRSVSSVEYSTAAGERKNLAIKR